jgi:hypothetical protein
MLQVEEKRGAPNIYINILNNHISKKNWMVMRGETPNITRIYIYRI